MDEDRWPSIPVAFHRSPELIGEWTALGYGPRINVFNPLDEGPPDTIDAFVEGHGEAWDQFLWSTDLNTSPASPYQIAVVQGALAIQDTPRVGSGTATLAAAVDEDDTSLSVTTGAGGLWTTVAANFPMDIDLGGEQVTLSAISGVASPQTFTVSARSVNGIVKAHLVGASIEVWQIATVGM